MRSPLIITAFVILITCNALGATPCSEIKAASDSWARASINRLVESARLAFKEDNNLAAFHNTVQDISYTIQRCKLTQDAAFAVRYRNFIDYTHQASLESQPGHELGFEAQDRQYFEETKHFVQIPDFLLSQSFLHLVSRAETLDRAKSFLARLNLERGPSDQLIFFSYKSRHLGTPDNDKSFLRLLVIVPSNPQSGGMDKWVQFGIADPNARSHIRNVSVVAAVAQPDGTSNIYFKDYYRIFRQNGAIDINGRWELGYGDDSCVTCHKSGVLPLFPEKGSVKSSELQLLSQANDLFRSYGPASFENYIDPTKFGPGLGVSTPDERALRFGPSFVLTAVGHAMVCSICHRSGGLGSLNWPMDNTLIRSFIEGGQMPLGNNLKFSERVQLLNKLIQEYFDTSDTNPGTLKAWLLRESTPAQTGKN